MKKTVFAAIILAIALVLLCSIASANTVYGSWVVKQYTNSNVKYAVPSGLIYGTYSDSTVTDQSARLDILVDYENTCLKIYENEYLDENLVRNHSSSIQFTTIRIKANGSIKEFSGSMNANGGDRIFVKKPLEFDNILANQSVSSIDVEIPEESGTRTYSFFYNINMYGFSDARDEVYGDPIEISVASSDMINPELNKPFTVKCSISGGHADTRTVFYLWQIMDEEKWVDFEEGTITSISGTLTFTPTDTDKARLVLGVFDSNKVNKDCDFTYTVYPDHVVEVDEAVDPTCTKTGKTQGKHCSNCGAIIEAQEDIPAMGHDYVHHDAKVATCTVAGWKAYDTCKRDGCAYTTYTKIPALGHKWDTPAYVWAADNSKVAAKHVCTRDASHTETETVETVYKVTKQPTYTAVGTGLYTSKPFTKSKDFKVQTKNVPVDMLPRTSITKAKVKAIDDQVYTGSAIKPALTVTYGGKKLAKGTDYTVSFKDNIKPGKATVTITGKNAYKGKTTVTFSILPKKVKLVSLKAGKKKLTVTWKKGAAITGYEIEYSLKKNFSGSKTVTVSGASTVKTQIKNLKPGKTYYVRIRAYRKVGSKKYYSDWSDKMKATVPEE